MEVTLLWTEQSSPRADTARLGAVRAALCACVLLACAGLAGPMGAARAAELHGVTLPETLRLGGHEMRLNGISLRSYSVFNVAIYVAGLYVEQPTHDPGAILAPRGDKALVFHFVRDVDEEHVRGAWREGFSENCPHPCAVPENSIQRFLDSVFGVRAGDVSMLYFSGTRMAATLNGRPAGSFDDAGMTGLLLASFFGPRPPEERMKRELLGMR